MRFSHYIVITQLIIVFVVSIVFALTKQGDWFSSFGGGLIGVINTLLSICAVNLGNNLKKVKHTMAFILMFAALRFILLGFMFYIGFSVFGFDFVPMLIAFALVQISYFFGVYKFNRKKS